MNILKVSSSQLAVTTCIHSCVVYDSVDKYILTML